MLLLFLMHACTDAVRKQTCRQIVLNGTSPVQVYQRLETMATVIPAAGQQDGSYLTGFSSAGLQ